MYRLQILARFLVLVGALNWGLHAIDYNVVEMLDKAIGYDVSKVIYIIIAASALYILFDFRDTMLPFLGDTVFPSGLLNETVPEKANIRVQIKTEPNKKVVFWATNPSENSNLDYKKAYGSYDNSGVTMSDSSGNAVLTVRRPIGYNESV